MPNKNLFLNIYKTFISFFLFALSLICIPQLCAQERVLDWNTFRQQVLSNHPLAQQADLYRNEATAGLLKAKGGFDPKLGYNYESKNFNGDPYFDYNEAELKLPTWFGLELKGAYNTARGKYLNSESKLPANGQAVFGLNWTLGQGLLIDERRANLRIARIGLQLNEAERNAQLNALLLDAAKVYWSWVLAANQLKVYESALSQAQIRVEGIRESFIQGDKPAIDTIETVAQYQNRRLDVYFAQLELQNATLALQNYMWDPNQQPLALQTLGTAPILGPENAYKLPEMRRDSLLQVALRLHPDLLYYENKLQSLNVERQWKNEKRKPVFDLNYNILGNGWQFSQVNFGEGPRVLSNDVKFGVQFSYPLLNRKARGDLQLADIKIAQTQLGLQQKRQDIENKVKQYANEIDNLANQVVLFRDFVGAYRALLDGELERFRFGESSIFLINSREQRWLDTQVKYLKLLSEFKKAEAGLVWATGAF
ncbi:MAG: TolC family protein [Saprospiraceae bacterium]|nr:TolC family protein [Saprospiraceae bacterium]